MTQVVSHEMRAPLGGIINSAMVLSSKLNKITDDKLIQRMIMMIVF